MSRCQSWVPQNSVSSVNGATRPGGRSRSWAPCGNELEEDREAKSFTRCLTCVRSLVVHGDPEVRLALVADAAAEADWDTVRALQDDLNSQVAAAARKALSGGELDPQVSLTTTSASRILFAATRKNLLIAYLCVGLAAVGGGVFFALRPGPEIVAAAEVDLGEVEQLTAEIDAAKILAKEAKKVDGVKDLNAAIKAGEKALKHQVNEEIMMARTAIKSASKTVNINLAATTAEPVQEPTIPDPSEPAVPPEPVGATVTDDFTIEAGQMLRFDVLKNDDLPNGGRLAGVDFKADGATANLIGGQVEVTATAAGTYPGKYTVTTGDGGTLAGDFTVVVTAKPKPTPTATKTSDPTPTISKTPIPIITPDSTATPTVTKTPNPVVTPDVFPTPDTPPVQPSDSPAPAVPVVTTAAITSLTFECSGQAKVEFTATAPNNDPVSVSALDKTESGNGKVTLKVEGTGTITANASSPNKVDLTGTAAGPCS